MGAKPGPKPHPLAGKTTSGSLALKSLSRTVTFHRLAQTIGCTRHTLQECANGSERPSVAVQKRLEEEFSIPTTEWDKLATETAPAATSEVRPLSGPITSGASEPTPFAPATDASESIVDTYRQMDRSLAAREVLAQKTGAPLRDLTSITQARMKVIAQIGKLTGELEITEAQVLRAPAFRAILDILKDMALKYPDAGRYIAERFAEYNQSSGKKLTRKVEK